MHRNLITARRVAAIAGTIAVMLLAGCGGPPPRPAPVIDRGADAGKKPAPKQPGATEFYTVRKGDTLYAIALEQGIDYKDLAAWNGLSDANRLVVGQQLRLRPPGSAASPAPGEGVEAVTVAPLATAPSVEGKAIGTEAAKPSTPVLIRPEKSVTGDLIKGPKAQRLPYSDDAMAQLKAAPSPFAAAGVIGSAAAAAPKSPPKAEAVPPPDAPKTDLAKVDPKPESTPPASGDDEDRVDWSWPASGKVVSSFTEGSNLKGIGIGGRAGQPVVASAGGKVVYAGSGLRGYGKLVIIKHNKTYLSVYAHNSEILVKEGQTVTKGQKIAEMGNTDADQVKLHFEIRRLGKPVDPLKFLPAAKG